MQAYYKHTNGDHFLLDGQPYYGTFHVTSEGVAYSGIMSSKYSMPLEPINNYETDSFLLRENNTRTAYTTIEIIEPKVISNKILNYTYLHELLNIIDSNNKTIRRLSPITQSFIQGDNTIIKFYSTNQLSENLDIIVSHNGDLVVSDKNNNTTFTANIFNDESLEKLVGDDPIKGKVKIKNNVTNNLYVVGDGVITNYDLQPYIYNRKLNKRDELKIKCSDNHAIHPKTEEYLRIGKDYYYILVSDFDWTESSRGSASKYPREFAAIEIRSLENNELFDYIDFDSAGIENFINFNVRDVDDTIVLIDGQHTPENKNSKFIITSPTDYINGHGKIVSVDNLFDNFIDLTMPSMLDLININTSLSSEVVNLHGVSTSLDTSINTIGLQINDLETSISVVSSIPLSSYTDDNIKLIKKSLDSTSTTCNTISKSIDSNIISISATSINIFNISDKIDDSYDSELTNIANLLNSQGTELNNRIVSLRQSKENIVGIGTDASTLSTTLESLTSIHNNLLINTQNLSSINITLTQNTDNIITYNGNLKSIINKLPLMGSIDIIFSMDNSNIFFTKSSEMLHTRFLSKPEEVLTFKHMSRSDINVPENYWALVEKLNPINHPQTVKDGEYVDFIPQTSTPTPQNVGNVKYFSFQTLDNFPVLFILFDTRLYVIFPGRSSIHKFGTQTATSIKAIDKIHNPKYTNKSHKRSQSISELTTLKKNNSFLRFYLNYKFYELLLDTLSLYNNFCDIWIYKKDNDKFYESEKKTSLLPTLNTRTIKEIPRWGVYDSFVHSNESINYNVIKRMLMYIYNIQTTLVDILNTNDSKIND